MKQEKTYLADSLMTSIIDKVMKREKNDPLMEYIRETIEKCNILSQGGLTERALLEIKFLIINLEKQLEI